MSKVTIVLAGAVGYVLGARAGQERYQQIRSQAGRVWKDPRVQEKAAQAQDLVKENAPKVQAKVADAASAATAKAKQAAHRSDDADGSADVDVVVR
jgi:hypothetical protein